MPVFNALNGLGTHFLLVSHSNVSEAKQRFDIIKTTSAGNLSCKCEISSVAAMILSFNS